MAKQPVVGLGDMGDFDPSLQTDEVDHDFFDNPAPFPTSNESDNEQTSLQEPLGLLVETLPVSLPTSQPLLPPTTSQQIFSTDTLLACLNSSDNELKIDLNDDQKYNFNNISHREDNFNESYSSPSSSHKKTKKCPETRSIKLFDLSDSSSDDASQDSDEELNRFMEKYHDFLDVVDSDVSDITEISPMSSLAVSPFTIDHQQCDDHFGIQSANNLLSIVQQNLHVNSTDTEFCSNNSGQSDSIPVIRSTNNLLRPTPLKNIKMISAEDLPTTTTATTTTIKPSFDDDESKDQNQNGERSPSNSSCISSANSTHYNTCSSSLSFSMSSSTNSPTSRRSASSSSTSSSSSMGPRSKTVRNHSFTPDQLKRIERENGILLKKILDTQRHHHHHHHSHTGVRGSRNGSKSLMQCSATISRQKQQRRIDYENSLLMKRLQTVKPSKEIEEAFKANNNV